MSQSASMMVDPFPDATEAHRLVEAIRPIFAGHSDAAMGAALADLLAMWLAGYVAVGDPKATDALRETLLAAHIAAVRQLIPVNFKGLDGAPGYWMNETSGVLAPAVKAYLGHDELTPQEIAALRAYFRQWVNAPGFVGGDVDELRKAVDGLISRQAIERWLEKAIAAGIDPL